MNTILILLIFAISLFVAFLLGRYTSEQNKALKKDKEMLKKLKEQLGPQEKTTIHSPSQKAKAKRDMKNITNE